ncbi:hypothetical protein P168DRAFT_283983 [Aspergillus campestris IBT 28561]|uniref:Uncharacterized protein n=1 Tax=Aspergillus campestris (strain IBT 28561) TaxID=1392248 RepID=A0A2I1CXB3_ASPC2|nr:uncharacterized protein P168DRAFT_283983 [Aspergillus campestris IBT 28561]PKY02251.1 hypothetical protein P168DRAFT_283983 [Aspergillus campestris IBT 28561]
MDINRRGDNNYTKILSFTEVPPRTAPFLHNKGLLVLYSKLRGWTGFPISLASSAIYFKNTQYSRVIVNPRKANNNNTFVMQADDGKYKSDRAIYGDGFRRSYASSCVLPEFEPDTMGRKYSLPVGNRQSDPTHSEEELGRFTDDLTKHLDAAFHIESNEVELSLSAIEINPNQNTQEHDEQPETEHIEVKQDSPSKRRSLRERVRSFASNSKASIASDRVSWQSFSSGHAELARSLRSNSVTTFTGSVGNTSTKSSPKAKRDYMFVDLDYFTHPRPMSEVTSPDVSPRAKKPVRTRDFDEQDKSAFAFRELVDYIRTVTGTEVKAQSLEDFNMPETMQDIKNRSAMHLRCTSCRGDCPVCGAACCIYEYARRAAALVQPSSEMARQSKTTLHTIENLGPHIRNAGTFSLCSEWYGCGRYVCSNCAGACKPDPWCPCDWYSID